MDQSVLDAITRDKGSDSSLNQIRQEGFIPGVLYGNGNNSQLIQINKKNFLKQLKEHGRSAIFRVAIGNEQVPVKMNEIQKDLINGDVMHVDFQQISLDKLVDMVVPFHIFGQSVGTKNGGIIQQQLREIEVRALPSFIPESIHVNVSDLDIGDAFYVRDINFPDEVQVLHDLDSVVLRVLPPKISEEGIEEDPPQSEPEVIDAKDGKGIDAAK